MTKVADARDALAALVGRSRAITRRFFDDLIRTSRCNHDRRCVELYPGGNLIYDEICKCIMSFGRDPVALPSSGLRIIYLRTNIFVLFEHVTCIT